MASFFPSLKQNFIAYRSSKESDCIFEIPQLWQSGFSRVYSNCCCSCSFEPEIIRISQSSHKMYSNNTVNFQESTTLLNAHSKKVWKLIVCTSYDLFLLQYLISFILIVIFTIYQIMKHLFIFVTVLELVMKFIVIFCRGLKFFCSWGGDVNLELFGRSKILCDFCVNSVLK